MDDDYSAIGIGVLCTALTLGTGWLIYDSVKKTKKELKRMTTPCSFDNGISQQDFSLIVARAGRPIKRIEKLVTNGPIVIGIVKSNSGLSTWNFVIDFNDHGHLTGNYWILVENSDSIIATTVAQSIQSSIRSSFLLSKAAESESLSLKTIRYCSKCGQKRRCESACFCPHCGHQFSL